MKLFDFEAAKRGDPICIEGGAKVYFLAVDPQTGHVWARVDGENVPVCWDRTGKEMYVFPWPPTLPSRQIFMVPKKRTVFVNAYPTHADGTCANAGDAFWYDTPENADAVARDTRIGGKAWPMEIEE